MWMRKWWIAVVATAASGTANLCLGAGPAGRPWIFPAPREMVEPGGDFILDDRVTIAIPSYPSPEDLFLAGMLADDLGAHFGVHLKTERVETLDPHRRAILIGSIANPLVREYCAGHGLVVNPREPGPEGYLLRTDGNVVLVAGSDERGAFYGLQSLRQLAAKDQDQVRFKGVRVRDWPA